MATNYNKISKDENKNKKKNEEPQIFDIQKEETNKKQIIVNGWINKDLVDEIQNNPTQDVIVDTNIPIKNKLFIVKVSKLNVRSSPNIKSSIIRTLNINDIVNVEDILNNDWVYVSLTGGTKGYVMKEFIKEI